MTENDKDKEREKGNKAKTRETGESKTETCKPRFGTDRGTKRERKGRTDRWRTTPQKTTPAETNASPDARAGENVD